MIGKASVLFVLLGINYLCLNTWAAEVQINQQTTLDEFPEPLIIIGSLSKPIRPSNHHHQRQLSIEVKKMHGKASFFIP